MDSQYVRSTQRPRRRLKIEEQLVDARVGIKLGMECAGKLVAIAYGGNCTVRQRDERLDAVANLDDARSTDKRCGDRRVFCDPRFVQERTLRMEAAELATIGVAPY